MFLVRKTRPSRDVFHKTTTVVSTFFSVTVLVLLLCQVRQKKIPFFRVCLWQRQHKLSHTSFGTKEGRGTELNKVSRILSYAEREQTVLTSV